MVSLANRITASGAKSYGMFARAAAIQGRDLIHLELGMPIHDTPQLIKDATIDALQAGEVHYTDFRGIAPLREALARRVSEHNGIPVTADQVLVTNGLTHASYVAFMATIDPGDEVILLDPHYPQHVGKVKLCGGTVVLAPMDAENDFALNPALIEPCITERTKAIVMVNPCNPTGRVFTREELAGLAELAIRHDLLVISDEVYEQVLFDDAKHISIASLPGMAERTITTFAFTKAYAMDGWRVGYVVAEPRFVEAMIKVSANMVTHVNTFIQFGALAAIEHADEVVAEMMAEDRAKRDIVVQALNQMPGVTCTSPEGTIYAFANVRATGRPSQELAEAILEHTGVVVEAGSFYGPAGEGHLRVCFGSQTDERLKEAMERLSGFFNAR
ncbi:pyridoxal phosphate-dependent aminotransferase [Novosphingobium resinovorum]|uniref:pyridoxal phosphate-dependent aminotransferase n=1 Tax=Novosphingobium TaxID=165696 RepID=UPI002005AC1C|nr:MULTISPECIES: pyridoxal phosphate-dependent aminotransferase [Novosphingobium]MBF7013657.1 pyridoxal phosphate-dependent aminotransferase [Novosphingobium sp. HR1a]WJM25806.1 pyridoxal phosphate-dependent aminotransferase [Novosphingobium resinovorum]